MEKPTRHRLSRHPLIRPLLSLELSVYCLVLLFILTGWGTLYQAENGLYAAQKKFFHSWIFLGWNLVPLPGGMLVMTVLFLNLTAAALFRLTYQWSKLGLILMHYGLMFLLAGAFFTFRYGEESFLSLNEGESSNVSTRYREWELALWQDGETGKQVYAVDADRFKAGDRWTPLAAALTVSVDAYYPNCEPAAADPHLPAAKGLLPKPSGPDPEGNFPGGFFRVSPEGGEPRRLTLHGGDLTPAMVEADGSRYFLSLRRKRDPLPLTLKLLDFKKEVHQGTEMARNFESRVAINAGGVEREVRIYMNHPLRFANVTFFQSSYSTDALGREISTFAVVKNTGWLFPYLASLIIFAGLALHFGIMLVAHGQRRIHAV